MFNKYLRIVKIKQNIKKRYVRHPGNFVPIKQQKVLAAEPPVIRCAAKKVYRQILRIAVCSNSIEKGLWKNNHVVVGILSDINSFFNIAAAVEVSG